MTLYLKQLSETQVEFPYTVAKLRRDNPNVGFTKNISNETLASFNVFPVSYAPAPEHNPKTHYAVKSQPTLVDGAWTIVPELRARTTAQIEEYNADVAEQNRNTRQTLLEETDFYALSDVTMSSEMQAYRQALRDLPDHTNWPHLEDADWPTKPSA